MTITLFCKLQKKKLCKISFFIDVFFSIQLQVIENSILQGKNILALEPLTNF